MATTTHLPRIISLLPSRSVTRKKENVSRTRKYLTGLDSSLYLFCKTRNASTHTYLSPIEFRPSLRVCGFLSLKTSEAIGFKCTLEPWPISTTFRLMWATYSKTRILGSFRRNLSSASFLTITIYIMRSRLSYHAPVLITRERSTACLTFSETSGDFMGPWDLHLPG